MSKKTKTNQEKNPAGKLKAQTRKPQTKAEILRDSMKKLDTRIARLSEISPEASLEILSLFDHVNQVLDELGKKGMNLASELGQLETLTAKFYKKQALFVRRIGGTQQLVNARKIRQPTADLWWWFADENLAEDRKQMLFSTLRNFGIVVIVLIIAAVIYKNFFAPDPNIQASYGHLQGGEIALMEGKFEDALFEVQQALAYTPGDPDLYVLQGVIQEALVQPEEAKVSFDTAILKYTQDDHFYNQRTILYLMMDDPVRALADCETAIQINPDSAISYLNKGQAYEILGDIQKAIESYTLADEIAQRTGNAQLQAIIRVSLSNAYQKFTLPTLDDGKMGE
jgi:tetratricopeptide (TPR) repeat protein